MTDRAKRLWIIVGVVAVVALWIASGALFREPETEEPFQAAEHTVVAVRHSRAEEVERLLVLQGEVQPEQVVEVRAETSGQVQAWHVPRGAAVAAGDLLVTLEPGERVSQQRQAEARLNVARQQLNATRQLVAEGFEPEIQLETAQAELEAAQAGLAAVEEELARTRIHAPIPGRINRRRAEAGDFLAAGGEVAQIVNNHPLRATVQVAQHQIGRLRTGLPARVQVLGHDQAEGEVSFVASLADSGTRTFRVEVEIPNPDRALPAGTSAAVEIITERVKAHQISPAIVSLDDEGQIGVKTVNADDQVEFHPVNVVRAQRSGLWVTGLPDEATIITVGQGFVSPGETVVARDEARLNGEPDTEGSNSVEGNNAKVTEASR